ncbi:hypothetical protein AAG906_012932 [Vitis piasezkii]
MLQLLCFHLKFQKKKNDYRKSRSRGHCFSSLASLGTIDGVVCRSNTFVKNNTGIGVSQVGCQVRSRCSEQGPLIRFPFWLKDQPHSCGYPGFELACVQKKQTMLTMLELPNSVKLMVKKINYKSQEIVVQDPDNCLSRQLLNLNPKASLFSFKLENNFPQKDQDFTIFNCSSPKEESDYFHPIRCAVGNYAVPSSSHLHSLDLFSCHGIYRAYLPYEILVVESDFTMIWEKSICENCEAQGKLCRLKPETKKLGTECISKNGAPMRLIGGIIFGFFILMLVLVAVYHAYRTNKSKKENQIKIESFLEDYKALKPSRYSYVDIKKITNKFKEKLGEGGYGTVYKGKLSNDILVAVKVLNNSKGNGEEFINEVGTIGRIHHVNVVRLVGFCADGSIRALIYEFLPNESLEKFIFSVAGENHSLGWEKLQHIAIGGRKNIDATVENTSQVYFPEWVYCHLNQGKELNIRAEKGGDTKIAKKLTIVGLWCIQWYPIDRPSMKVAVQMLEGEGDNLTMPPNPFASWVQQEQI